MKREIKHFGIPKAASLDKERECNNPEFDVLSPDHANQQTPASYGGSFEDIARLKPVIDALRQMKEAETRHFIVLGLTALFVVWTVIGLLFYILTGNSWILVSGAGPGTLFGTVVYYYFQKKKRKWPHDEQ